MIETTREEIFHRWLTDHKAAMIKVVRTYADDEEDQEDLFQEIAVQLWRSVTNFRGDAKEITWIYRVALNTAIRWIKKEKRRRDTERDEEIHLWYPTEKDERLDWLYKQIGQLNEVDRSVTLLMLEGLSYKEIADLTGISENYVAVKINRIKKELSNQTKSLEL